MVWFRDKRYAQPPEKNLDETARLAVERAAVATGKELAMTTFGPLENYLTPAEEAEIVADINSGRWPYITSLIANDNVPVAEQPARLDFLPTADGGVTFHDDDQFDPNTRFGDFIQTYTGKQFWPMDPRVSDVDIEDVAHALSMQCRYAGHCLRFYSVAEHSVHMAAWLTQRYDARMALCGLLHDATEAYLCDVPRPIKPHLGGYKAAEANIWVKAIAPAFGLPEDIPAAVHEADSRILLDERSQNMSPASYRGGWPDVEPLGITLEFWPPETAELYFMDTFKKLMAAREAENMRVAA